MSRHALAIALGLVAAGAASLPALADEMPWPERKKALEVMRDGQAPLLRNYAGRMGLDEADIAFCIQKIAIDYPTNPEHLRGVLADLTLIDEREMFFRLMREKTDFYLMLQRLCLADVRRAKELDGSFAK